MEAILARVAELERLTADLTTLEASVVNNSRTLRTLPGSVDTFYLITCGALVFFTQAGFGLLEAGSVRTKNTRNILLKNLLDACALSPSAPAAQPTPGTRGAHRPSWHAQVRRRIHLVGVGLRHGVPHRRRRRQPVHRAARQGPRLRRLGARGRV